MYAEFSFFCIFATNQDHARMTNQQFTEHLKGRVEAAEKAFLEDKTEENRKQLGLLKDALRIMTHGTGQARRRFRRDYERNLARQGVKPA